MRIGDEEASQEVRDKADHLVQQDIPKTWKSYVWDSLSKSPEER